MTSLKSPPEPRYAVLEFQIDNDAQAALGLLNAPGPGATVQITAEVVASDVWWRTTVRIVRLVALTDRTE